MTFAGIVLKLAQSISILADKFQAVKRRGKALWNKLSQLILSAIVVKTNRKRCTLLFAMYTELSVHHIPGFYHLMKTKTRD